MYMYNVIVYVWDLSNEQPVTIIEHRTRFFVPDCLCRLEKKSTMICMTRKQDISRYLPYPLLMFATDFLNICQVHIYPDICSPREAAEYQNYNISTATASASIAAPPGKLLLHVYLPKKKSQTRFKTFHQHLMLIAQLQGRFFKRRKLIGESVS